VITFRAKPVQVWNMDDTPAYQYVPVPVLRRSHCDMEAFRRSRKYGGIANSELFPNALTRIRRDMTGDMIRLDRPLPAGVAIDLTGFLAAVTLTPGVS